MFIQRCLSLKKPSYGYRRLISLSANPLVDDSDNIVDVEGTGSSRTAILSRPSSLNAINIPMIREGRSQTLEQCLTREYRMSVQAISGQITGDFCEGVRAKPVDKDFAPKWDPPSLEHVSQDMVDQYFSPLPASEPELELPTRQRAAF
ncbi:UNVERIFIED_CONTAM: 3-hydroxyisobutyryl-CoA hydrolase-like protein 1, mitochondrial [Sesamum indicum]